MRLTGNSVVCERCGSRIIEQDWGNGGRVWADQSDGRAHSDVRCLTGRVLSLESKLATAVHRAEVAEQRWQAVIDEASRLLSRDMPQMLFAHDKISVPIEAYNEMAAMAFRFAGYCKTAQDMIRALGTDQPKEKP